MKSKVLGLICALSYFVYAESTRKNLKFQIDRGEVNLSFKVMTKPFEYSIKYPEHCQGTIKKTVKSDGAIFRHMDPDCPTGATIDLVVNNGQSIELELESGVVQVKGGESLKSEFHHIGAKVQSGVIQTNFDHVFQMQRTGSNAKMMYQNRNKSVQNGIQKLFINVKAGVVII